MAVLPCPCGALVAGEPGAETTCPVCGMVQTIAASAVELQETLAACRAVADWAGADRVIGLLMAGEGEPAGRAQLAYERAQIVEEKLGDRERAVNLYHELLDQDPCHPSAFGHVVAILSAREEWKQLERAHRKQLVRLAGKGARELELSLWSGLADLYRRLGNADAAALAAQMARRLESGS